MECVVELYIQIKNMANTENEENKIMNLTIKNGKLYDEHSGQFINYTDNWAGHGEHDKQPICDKSMNISYIPYLCECGMVLIDLHEGNLFRD